MTPRRALLLSLLLVGCSTQENGQVDSTGSVTGSSGGGPTVTLHGPETMSAFDRARFERGRVMFEKQFKPSEGLGPLYNATACRSCHSTPVVGGSAPLYRNFYVAMGGEPDQFQFALPGLPSLVVPNFGDEGQPFVHTLTGGRPIIPDQYFGFNIYQAQRGSISALGVGLFEFVSNATILSNADPEDADGDGISGRYNTEAGAIGRFGVKAQANNLESFTRAPLMNQMGITTDPFLGAQSVVSLSAAAAPQGTVNPFDPLTDLDSVADPEMSPEDLGDLIFFSSNLPAPKKKTFDAAAIRGEQLFDQIGCAKCHIPSLPSSKGPVDAYTDLLIHDMGPALADNLVAGTPQLSPSSPGHTGSEWRTAPLWGVSDHPPYLHDGRAETLEEAILLHAGEAAGVTAQFQALGQADRNDVIHFLERL